MTYLNLRLRLLKQEHPKVFYSLQFLLILLIMICLTATSGCSIGVKEKQTIVYSQVYKTPEQCKGAIRIATNKKIEVTIEGEKDISTTMDIGGRYVIDYADLSQLLRNTDELQKIKERRPSSP